MKQKQEIKSLLEKEMDRKEFLMHLGIGALAVVGISSLINNLNRFNSKPAVQGDGYGSSTYGGSAQSR